MGSQGETTGYVEISINGTWGTICGKNFTRKEAAVVCHQLGFQDGVALAAGSSGNQGSVVIGQAVCTGSEDRILDCILTGFAEENADCVNHTTDAAVHCFNTGIVRLVTKTQTFVKGLLCIRSP